MWVHPQPNFLLPSMNNHERIIIISRNEAQHFCVSQRMPLLSLPRELLYLIAHTLTIAEVHYLAQCNVRLYQLLTKEEYWYDRALCHKVVSYWDQLKKFTSWRDLYRGATSKQCFPHQESFVLCYNNIAWTVNNELYLLRDCGYPRCNLTEKGVHPRCDSDGHYAIVASRSNLERGRNISFIAYINSCNELWLFTCSSVLHFDNGWTPEITRHILIYHNVQTAGGFVDGDEDGLISLMIVTMEKNIFHYQKRLPYNFFRKASDSHEEVLLGTCEQWLFLRQSIVTNIVCIHSGYIHVTYYFHTEDFQVFHYNTRYSAVKKIGEFHKIYHSNNTDTVLFYHRDQGWKIYDEGKFYPCNIELDHDLITLKGMDFYYYDGCFSLLIDYIRKRGNALCGQ